jgi:hypothetical protein
LKAATNSLVNVIIIRQQLALGLKQFCFSSSLVCLQLTDKLIDASIPSLRSAVENSTEISLFALQGEWIAFYVGAFLAATAIGASFVVLLCGCCVW